MTTIYLNKLENNSLITLVSSTSQVILATTTFPSEIWNEIFAKFSLVDFSYLSLVSKQFYDLTENPNFSKASKIFSCLYVLKNPSLSSTLLKKNYLIRLLDDLRTLDSLNQFRALCCIENATEIKANILENFFLALTQVNFKQRDFLLDCLKKFYTESINEKDLEVNFKQIINNKTILKIIKEQADRGSEKAIELLLNAYQLGELGLNKENLNVQQKGLKLTKKYTKNGSEIAIKLLLDSYNKGFFGLDKNDVNVQQKGLELTKKYAELKSNVAISYLISTYKEGYFGLDKNNPIIQQRSLEIAQKYADFGSEPAIDFLIKPPFTPQKPLEITEKYAELGSEHAIEILIRAYKYGFLGINKEDPVIQQKKGELIKKYANKGSEIARDYLFLEHLSNHFDLDENNSEKQQAILNLAKYYVKQGSLSALKFLMNKITIQNTYPYLF